MISYKSFKLFDSLNALNIANNTIALKVMIVLHINLINEIKFGYLILYSGFNFTFPVKNPPIPKVFLFLQKIGKFNTIDKRSIAA